MPDSLERPASALENKAENSARESDVALKGNPRSFTSWQRLQIFAASWLGYLAMSLIGRTLRWEISGWEHWVAAEQPGKRMIYTCWHREIFAASWFWRKRGIVVMTSQNFDGEYIARIIQKLGYGAARGSSSRGAVGALVEMRKAVERKCDAGFTIDGPRGPRFIAKPGSVLLAKATGAAILCFHAALRRAFVFRKSWDQTQFPYPFCRAAMFIAAPIWVAPDAGDEEQSRKLQEVQAALDGLRRRAEAWESLPGKPWLRGSR